MNTALRKPLGWLVHTGWLLLLAATLLPAQAVASVAGRVVFVSGTAQRQAAQGPAQALQLGDTVSVGDAIHTQTNGYVHLRMVDDGFVALRPGSRLRIGAYQYNAGQPQASRIRLDLDEGRSRVVSGQGGQAAKQHYRFNTPLAAIGLRGTDYTVFANADTAQVSVAQGAVVVSPYRGACSPDELGPCHTPWAMELDAATPHAYLELTRQNPEPRLVPQPTQPAHPDTLPPGAADTRQFTPEARAASVLATPQPVIVPLYPSTPTTQWGRWSDIVAQQPAGSPAVGQVFKPEEHTILATNPVFVLLAPKGTGSHLPQQGSATFKLAAAEAYVLQQGTATPGKVLGGTLQVDFAQNTFGTQVQVQTAHAGLEHVNAAGTFNRYGQLQANPAQSNAQVAGALLGTGTQAAYLFDKPLAGGAQLLGATQWGR